MATAIDIHEQHARVLEAQHAAVGARQALLADKQARSDSLLARFMDAVTTTPSEAALNAAEARLESVTKQARKAAHALIVAHAGELLANQPEEYERHRKQKQILDGLQKRSRQISHLFDLARTAADMLSAAATECDAASTAELLDLVSKNKAVSALSYLGASNASDAIDSASQAIKALTEALPDRSVQVDIEQPNDALDLVVDLAFDPGIDLLSLVTLGRLEDAAQQCREAADRLQPLHDRLHKLAGETREKVDQALALLHSIESPHLDAAAALVPEVLRVPTPKSLSDFAP